MTCLKKHRTIHSAKLGDWTLKVVELAGWESPHYAIYLDGFCYNYSTNLQKLEKYFFQVVKDYNHTHSTRKEKTNERLL